MRLRLFALIFIHVISVTSFASIQCAAFSKTGLFATAQIADQRLTLTLPNTREGSQAFSLRVSEPRRCSLSFSRDDAFVSVAIEKTKPSANQVEVAILSLANRSWVNGAVITPKFGHVGGGFVGDTHEVATAFISGRLEQGISLPLQIFTINVNGKDVRQRALRPLEAPSSSLFPTSFDSEHNRIWYRVSSGQCGLRAVNILGDRTEIVSVQPGLIPKCLSPLSIDFPTVEFAVLGSQLASEITFSRIGLASQHVEGFTLPSEHDEEYQLLDLVAHSPDGKLECFVMRAMKRDRVGGSHQAGYRLAIFQVEPWKVLATVPVAEGVDSISSLAIEYLSGRAHLEFWTGSRWQLITKDLVTEKAP